ncbi:MAG: glycerophosphodiester phosphodiesterase [Bacteroidia bacterium]
MRKINYYLVLIILSISCRNAYEAPVPDLTWELFEHADAEYLTPGSINKIEGIYTVTDGNFFGGLSIFKGSYVINNNDTTWKISVFSQASVKYFICEGKQLNGAILLDGYWRNLVNTETGRARLTITLENGAGLILNNGTISQDSIIIEGVYGTDNNVPLTNVKFNFLRSLNFQIPFEILAHRGGGRTSDLLPASENSVELIKMAAHLGATGVEIDVRMTSDNVPVLYHDENLNDRLTQKSGLVGELNNYTYAQLSAFVRLKNGELIPTLQQALNAIIYETPLKIVWLDIKYDGSLETIKNIQQEFLQKAAAANRDVKIYIGIPTNGVRDQFVLLNNHTSVPSLVELSIDVVQNLEAEVWAPRWTEGIQNDLVQQMHSENRKVYVWTMDVQGYVQQYISQGNFDGILSNYPTMIAFYHYVQ